MSRFSQLMQHGQRKVNFRQRQARLLMTMSDDQHKAIARLIQRWLDESTASGSSTLTAAKPARRSK